MGAKRILALGLVCLLLAGCAATSVQPEQLAGCWYMGADEDFRYLARFEENGSFEILLTHRQIPEGTEPVAFRLPGTYTLNNGLLTRQYAIAPDEGSALTTPAELELEDGALILYYGVLTESWPRLSEEGERICLEGCPGEDCSRCAGTGILGYRQALPVWCPDCCGLGVTER